jgi:galactonate dehydratase
VGRIVDVDLLLRRVSARTTWQVLRLRTADGVVGLGECSDAAAPAAVRRAVVTVRNDLVGRDCLEAGAVLTATRRRRDRASTRPEAFLWSTLLGALDCALLDLAARYREVPLHEVVGGEAVGAVPLYANLNRGQHDRSPRSFAVAAGEAETAGFGAVKIAPFDGPHDGDPVECGLEIVHAVRERLRTTTSLMVDVHHRLTPRQLDRALPALESCGLTWLEDAVDVLDEAALTALAGRTRIPLAGGEHLWHPREVARACRPGVLAYLLVDAKHAGGPTQVVRLLEEAGDTDVTFHNPSGPVGTALSAHLTGLRPPGVLVELAYGEPGDRSGTVTPAECVAGGTLTVDGSPGLGVDLVEEMWSPS